MTNLEDITGKKKHGDGWGYMVMSGIVLLLVISIPLALASILFVLLRARVKKNEAWIIVAVSAVGILVNPKAVFTDYFVWMFTFFGGEGSKSDIPWYSLAVGATLLVGLALALRGTRATAWIPTSIGNFRPNTESTEILPTAKEKEKVQLAPSTRRPLTVTAQDHSILSGAEKGKREIPIGIDKLGRPVKISEAELKMHALIFGSTGSGKSETIKTIAGALLDLGWDGMILDLKEDTAPGGLRDWCDTYAQTHSMPYQEVRLSDPNPTFWFDPLAGMQPDEARDTILSMQTFEAGFYEALNKQQLGELLTVLYAAHEIDPVQFPTPTLGDIGKILSAIDMKAALKKHMAVVISETTYTPEDFPALSGKDKDFVATARGLGARIASDYASQAGRVLLSPPPPGVNRPRIDITQGGVTYIGLDSTGKISLSRVIATSTLKRMAVYASQRISGGGMKNGRKPDPRFLIIDEANFVDRLTVMALLSRARSSGICVILCTQGPMDWASTGNEPGVEALAQNTNVVIIMAQGERKNAEVCSDLIGHGERTTINHQMREGVIDETSGGIQKTVEAKVSPDYLMSGLTIGEAIVRVGKPTSRVVWTKVSMRDPKYIVPRR